jgi:cytochrome c553
VKLQGATKRFGEKGIGVVGISYDTRATLKLFSEQHGITFPLLSDSTSTIIRRFGLLNPRGLGFTAGMAIPGFFFVGPDRRIRETFFEDEDNNRYTPNTIIAKLFPELITADERTITAPHLTVTLTQSDSAIIPGNRATLVAVVTLPPGIHVYAPGVQGGYKPTTLELEPTTGVLVRQLSYPTSRVLLLPAIGERVPVFEGTFRIAADVMLNQGDTYVNEYVPKGAGTLTLKGRLRYQACDSTICYPPDVVPVSWSLTARPVPMTDGKGNAKAGEAVFRQHCQTCHGANGDGKTTARWTMGGRTMPLRPLATVIPGMSDEEMRLLIQKGYGPIKLVPGLTADEIDNVVAYVRSLET